MGKGQIINDFGDGRYAVKLLQNREKADQALARIDTWIALNQKRQSAIPPGDPEHKLPMLKFSMASLLKQKEYLLLIPQDAIADAWCADLTEELTGEVGTIEINGDPKAAVNIRPGYTDNAAHVPERDGQTMNIRAMTPEQAFYNLAMMPGWQKWRPTYRVGAITSINGDTCSVRLDDANSSLKGAEYNINQAWDLTDVDIEYMDCNGAAFEPGDRVIVQFIGQDFEVPKVIGFEDNPKPCGLDLVFISVNASNNVEFYTHDGTKAVLFRTLDINSIVNGQGIRDIYPIQPYQQYVSIFHASSDLNSVILGVFINDWRGNTQGNENGDTWAIFNRYMSVKVPVLFHGNELIAKDIRIPDFATHFPELSVITPSGNHVYLMSNPISGIGAGIGFGITPLTQYTRTWPWYYFRSDVTPRTYPWAVGCSGNLILLCTVTEEPPYTNTIYRMVTGTLFFIGTVYNTRILTREELYGITQIVSRDSKFFVFYGATSVINPAYYPGITIQIEVLDLSLNIIKAKQSISGLSGYNQSTVSIVPIRYNDVDYTCLSFITNANIGTGKVSFVDIETLDLVTEITTGIVPALTQPYHFDNVDNSFRQSIPNFITIQKPKTNRMVEKINEYRFTQPVYYEYTENYVDYYMPYSYVGYSELLQACAQQHANWCVANCRMQHEDANDELSTARAVPYGFRYDSVSECMCMMDTTIFISLNDQIDEAIRMWKESPKHDAALKYRDSTTMGFATAVYPESCHTIIIGKGSYNVSTGSYSTVPGSLPLIPSEYGKMKVFVYLTAAA